MCIMNNGLWLCGGAQKAHGELAQMEVRGRQLRLGYSQPNTRLYVGNIPKHLGVQLCSLLYTLCSVHSFLIAHSSFLVPRSRCPPSLSLCSLLFLLRDSSRTE